MNMEDGYLTMNFDNNIGAGYLQKLGADLECLLEGTYSDVVISVQGRAFPLHRAVLAARCSFFRNHFRNKQTDSLNLSEVQNLENVGSDAFAAVIKYVYGGTVRPLTRIVACVDELCPHDACWPAVNFVLDFLSTASVLDLPELKFHAQEHLLSLVSKVPVEYVLHMMGIGRAHMASQLQAFCLTTLANSNWDLLNLEKCLPDIVIDEIKALRTKSGVTGPCMEEDKIEKQSRRIRRALDSDDVQLVRLLLKEAKISLDDVQGLHYAAEYCDAKTIAELMDERIANVNVLDARGLTVLHTAAMRREPEVLASLLDKGANTDDLTPDGRTALQIVRRLTRKETNRTNEALEEQFQRDTLCIEILKEAEKKKITFSKNAQAMLTPALNEKEFFLKLLYLENRVALARMLFPREAKIVMDISQLDTTSEFTPVDRGSVRLVIPGESSGLSRKTSLRINANADRSPPTTVTSLMQRVGALQKTMELGHRFFPRCSAIINKYVDDDTMDQSTDNGNPEEQVTKKKRYMEIKESFAKAFIKDVADMDKQKPNPKLVASSAPSPSSA